MNKEDLIKINVDTVLRERLPRHYRYIPKWVIRWVERTICQDQLNELLEYAYPKQDAEFCHAVLEKLNVKYKIIGEENLMPTSQRRVVFVSNHPLGALDGIVMIDYVSKRYGGILKFVVNDLLMAVKPLEGVFLPINKHGRQSRRASVSIDDAFSGNDPIIIFPAGLCSRRQKDGTIKDLEWRKMFVNKCAEYHRDIIPVHFDAENSSFFYKFAKFRTHLGLKLNIEMIYLPREIFRCKNECFQLTIGEPIAWNNLKTGLHAQSQANEIKEIVYNLTQS